ncbi:MAG: alpha-amylase family glycosyl hydrolase [Chitinophagaceae bacterium]
MTEKFGAWQVGTDENEGQVEFKIFIPDRTKDTSQYAHSRNDSNGEVIPNFGDPQIHSIQVAGDFQHQIGQLDWDFEMSSHMVKEEHAKGWIWRYRTDNLPQLRSGFYQYKYYVTFENGKKRKVTDPCSRYGGSENQNSAFVIGGSDPAVRPLNEPRKHLRDLVVYELMIDDFTDEYRGARAPIEAVHDKVKYLKDDLGVTAILFMPWTAWPGMGFNWGYNPYMYFSVEYRYANAVNQPAEKLSFLKNLISTLHDDGIQVIMDGVFNHVAQTAGSEDEPKDFPYQWFYQNPEACPYVGKFGGTFSGLKDLDFYQGCTQEFVRAVCLYWIDDFKIDGIRFDNTTNYYIPDEQRGLPQLLQDISDHVNSTGETNFALVLEHLNMEAAQVTNKTSATSYWNNALYQCCFDYLWNQTIDSRIMNALNNHLGLEGDKVATTYIGNHDHSHVAWQAGARNNNGALEWYRTQPYAIALLTCPGAVMIQNGQEFGEDYWVMEDDRGSSRRVKPRPLRWDFSKDKIGSSLIDLYSKLIKIRFAHLSLRSDSFYPNWESWQNKFNPEGYGVDIDRQIVIYHRWGNNDNGKSEKFIIVLNFSQHDQVVDIPFSHNGTWQNLLEDSSEVVTGFHLYNYLIKSNWGKVFFSKD